MGLDAWVYQTEAEELWYFGDKAGTREDAINYCKRRLRNGVIPYVTHIEALWSGGMSDSAIALGAAEPGSAHTVWAGWDPQGNSAKYDQPLGTRTPDFIRNKVSLGPDGELMTFEAKSDGSDKAGILCVRARR